MGSSFSPDPGGQAWYDGSTCHLLCDKVDNAVPANVRAQAPAVSVESGSLAVVGARYDLDPRLVTILER
jgi:hypothetical protein